MYARLNVGRWGLVITQSNLANHSHSLSFHSFHSINLLKIRKNSEKIRKKVQKIRKYCRQDTGNYWRKEVQQTADNTTYCTYYRQDYQRKEVQCAIDNTILPTVYTADKTTGERKYSGLENIGEKEYNILQTTYSLYILQTNC